MATLDPRPEYPGPPERPAGDAIGLSVEQLFQRESLWRSVDEMTERADVRDAAKRALFHWTDLRGAGDWIMGVSERPEPSSTQMLTRYKFEKQLDETSDMRTLRTAARDLIQLVFQREAANGWLLRGKLGDPFDAAGEALKLRPASES